MRALQPRRRANGGATVERVFLSAIRARLQFPGVRRYHVTTFGCQMNAHDSERIKGMLEDLGLGEATSPDEADIVVFNTCTIR
jgi:Uncharacterized protein family UPF0004